MTLQGKSRKSKPAPTEMASDPQATKTPPKPSEPVLPAYTEEKSESAKSPDETDFEAFYLQQVTTEFADDLDKLRNASDFNEKSLPILIDALKSTARTYSVEEKATAMGRSR
ncbi:MAG: hypothetical protein L6R40_002836 [Gallowayella cf. fulva]|nr:MAG: hypothetical protein L6R40_002836 [Xanthomendoza cf. fulva]